MKAAVYLRVSSRDGRQDEANQEPDCLALCEARGWTPVVFRERESGAKLDRPVWREVLELARVGKVRAVVVWKIDRVGRRRVQVAHDLAELLRWRVEVVSIRDPWLEQADGRLRELLIEVMAWFAQGELDDLIARTNAGLARARAKGVKLGRRFTVPTAVLERASYLRGVPPSMGWQAVVNRLEREGLGRWSKNGIKKAMARWSPKGGAGAPSNPGPDAGLRAAPTGEPN